MVAEDAPQFKVAEADSSTPRAVGNDWGLAMEGSAKIAEAKRQEKEFLTRALQAEATTGDAKRKESKKAWQTLFHLVDGEAARGSGGPPPEITAKRVPKRLPGAGRRHGR